MQTTVIRHSVAVPIKLFTGFKIAPCKSNNCCIPKATSWSGLECCNRRVCTSLLFQGNLELRRAKQVVGNYNGEAVDLVDAFDGDVDGLMSDMTHERHT